MLSNTLDPSLLGNLLTCKDTSRASKGAIATNQGQKHT